MNLNEFKNVKENLNRKIAKALEPLLLNNGPPSIRYNRQTRRRALQLSPILFGEFRHSAFHYYSRANLRNTSMPRSSVASGAAKEIRKWVSRFEKILPGMINRSCSIARRTKSAAFPFGTLGNI